VLINYQNEMLEVIRSETPADLVDVHVRLLARTAIIRMTRQLAMGAASMRSAATSRRRPGTPSRCVRGA
jgi:hypothetical protein